MTKATSPTSTYEQAADAILQLINSKPRSPTRAELVAALAFQVLARLRRLRPRPTKQPSALGREVLRRQKLHAAALVKVSRDENEETEREFDETGNAVIVAARAVLGAPNPSIPDLVATIACLHEEGSEPLPELGQATHMLATAVFSAAGIPCPEGTPNNPQTQPES